MKEINSVRDYISDAVKNIFVARRLATKLPT
jgi:hypothetical protein